MDFKKEFLKAIKELSPNLNVVGAISEDGTIYSFGHDTKVLSTIFELLVYPAIELVAERFSLKIKTSPAQTVYPDFTLMKNAESNDKIAVDVKTTYLKKNQGKTLPFNFTLGSYTSFLRNNTKNIIYPYNSFKEHWIIGFVYVRGKENEQKIVNVSQLANLKAPYEAVKIFVQEKYKISGEKPGSGNTANIGSFKSNNIEDFDKGNGPFAKLGENVFREYWANYDRFPPRKYTDLKGFFEWKKKMR